MVQAPPIPSPPPVKPEPIRGAPPSPEQGIDWAAAGWAGLIAGVALILVQTALITLFSGGPRTDAIREIAAIALGQSVLPPSTPFTALVFVAAMSVHLPLSLLYARILAEFVDKEPVGRAVAIGAVFGAALYGLNYYFFSQILPWFAAARSWMAALSHVVFGVLAAALYLQFAARQPQS